MSRNAKYIALRNAPQDLVVFDIAFPVGAYLVADRDGYEHHGIYVGNGQVIHYVGFSRRQRRGPVERIPTGCFACGFAVTIQRDASPCCNGREVAHRVGSRLGECSHWLLTNNCEHFCSWRLFGECRSAQVEACLKSPVRAVHTLSKLMLPAPSIERWTAHPQARVA